MQGLRNRIKKKLIFSIKILKQLSEKEECRKQISFIGFGTILLTDESFENEMNQQFELYCTAKDEFLNQFMYDLLLLIQITKNNEKLDQTKRNSTISMIEE